MPADPSPVVVPRFRAWLGGVVAVAAALRLWELGGQGLWADEAVMAQWAQLPWAQFWPRLAGDTQAPLYLLLVRGLAALLGITGPPPEWVMRLPLGLASVATVALLPPLLGPVVGARAALLGAGALGVHAVSVHYARESRPYALLMFLWVVALGMAWRAARGQGAQAARGAVGLGVALALLAYTHNVALPAAGVLGLVALLGARDRAARWRVLGAGAGAALAYAPWWPQVNAQVGSIQHSYAWFQAAWVDQFPFQLPMSVAVTALGAPPPIRNGADAVGPLNAALAGLQVALVVAVAAWVPPTRRVLGVLVVLGLLPLLAMWLVCLVRTPFYVVGRVDVALVPVWCVVLGVALDAALQGPAARVVPVGVGVLLLGAVGPLWLELGVDTRSQERTVAHALAGAMAPGDVVVVATAHKDTLAYYLGRTRPDVAVRAYPPSREENAFYVPPADAAQLATDAHAVLERATAQAAQQQGTHVWLFTQPGPERDALEAQAQRTLVDAGGRELGFLGLAVHRFARTPATP